MLFISNYVVFMNIMAYNDFPNSHIKVQCYIYVYHYHLALYKRKCESLFYYSIPTLHKYNNQIFISWEVWLWLIVFNATFNNISAISWRSILLAEETGENHLHVASLWQTYWDQYAQIIYIKNTYVSYVPIG